MTDHAALSGTKRIVALTPNPAIDRILELDRELQPHALNRIAEVREGAGGKGVNLARVVDALERFDRAGEPKGHRDGVEVIAAGFLAGWNGRKFRSLLAQEGIEGHFLEVAGETRECQILLDHRGHPTELNDPGPVVGIDEWRALMDGLTEGLLVISGSLPPGISTEDFSVLLSSPSEPPVVDASGAALMAALGAGVRLVAPNRAELAAATGVEQAGLREARAVFRRYRVPVLLTLGDEGALYVSDSCYSARPPAVPVENPVGSGDALLAAFVWATERGLGEREALALGVAAGAANARGGGAGRVSGGDVHELRRQVRVEEAA